MLYSFHPKWKTECLFQKGAAAAEGPKEVANTFAFRLLLAKSMNVFYFDKHIVANLTSAFEKITALKRKIAVNII